MVTIQERRAARQAKSKARFAASGKKAATSLARTAETTAQRRGRGFDPLETVILQAVNPPPPPPPPPKKALTICDVLGTQKIGGRGSGGVPRGVSFACGNPIDFSSSSPNNTTRRIFGATIQANRAKVKAAGVFLGPSQAEKSGAVRQRKILRRKQRSCGRNISCIQSFSRQIDDIEARFGI